MALYLIYSGDAYSTIDVPSSLDDFSELARRFADLAGSADRYARMHRLWDFCHAFGVYWHEELVSSEGCSFVLLATPETPEADLQACETMIRKDRDVVWLRIVRFRRFIEPAGFFPGPA
jgi:hypothetical protein